MKPSTKFSKFLLVMDRSISIALCIQSYCASRAQQLTTNMLHENEDTTLEGKMEHFEYERKNHQHVLFGSLDIYVIEIL